MSSIYLPSSGVCCGGMQALSAHRHFHLPFLSAHRRFHLFFPTRRGLQVAFSKCYLPSNGVCGGGTRAVSSDGHFRISLPAGRHTRLQCSFPAARCPSPRNFQITFPHMRCELRWHASTFLESSFPVVCPRRVPFPSPSLFPSDRRMSAFVRGRRRALLWDVGHGLSQFHVRTKTVTWVRNFAKIMALAPSQVWLHMTRARHAPCV